MMAIFGLGSQVDQIQEAIKSGDPAEIAVRFVQLICMLFGMTSQCFTGDTLVSIEDGLRPIYVSADEVLVHNQCKVTGGKNLKEHYVKHKNLLTEVTGKKYPKYKESNECEEFLKDIGNLIDIHEVEFVGTGTLKKGVESMNIYRGKGITIELNNEFVTILKSGEGLDLGIMFD